MILEDYFNPLFCRDKKGCYTCYTCTTRDKHERKLESKSSGVENDAQDIKQFRCNSTKYVQKSQSRNQRKLDQHRTRSSFKGRLFNKSSHSKLKFGGMSHLFLFSLFLISSFLCYLVNGQQDFTHSGFVEILQKPKLNKLRALLQNLQLEKQLMDREKLAAMASRELMGPVIGSALLAESSSPYVEFDDMSSFPLEIQEKVLSAIQDSSQAEYRDGKNKRRNYMTLCHFKICNMGRKRWKS